MDRHLNVFLPYERPPHHEDQLTRAGMIVMRASPLARDALLGRLGALQSARLPEPEFDMQARHVLNPAGPPGAAGRESLRELISVFLTPDVGLDLSGGEVGERIGEQRLDGVLRFGDELVVVIESKVVDEAPSDQARLLRLRGVEVGRSRVAWLGWHELLDDWWGLLERGLLSPAEQLLMEDLFTFAEEHFAGLLPFTTLGRAGDHVLRRQRRLMALLREATGLDDVAAERRPWNGATLMLDAMIKTSSTQRIALQEQTGSLTLTTWPAELKPQAEALYRTDRGQRLIDFAARHTGAWQIQPNLQLAFRNASVAQRLFPHCALEVTEYIRRWAGADYVKVGAHHYGDIRENLWPWLRDRRYVSAQDDEDLDAFLRRLGRRDVHLRPGLEIRRTWPWALAVDLDERGALVGEVRQAITELLTTLDEPLPPACAAASGA